MFAKLKEKIQKEGGNVTDGERTLSPLPGYASPRQSTLLQSSLSKEKSSTEDGIAAIHADHGKVDSPLKEDVSQVLHKRTEQCKELETKVSALQKQTRELNEQYQASKAKMAADFKLELEQKEKVTQELAEKLKETESVRDKFYKKEEESEEMQQFTTQEMGKLKHMLILKEQELAVCQKELEDMRLKLEKQSSENGKIVSILTKERMALEESLSAVKIQLAERSSVLSVLQSKYTDLENTYQTLLRNSELLKNKLNQQLQEKSDHVDQLEDRLRLLQQREHNHSLSGDERVQALQKERDGLEKKLLETQEQLSQVKSSWSSKISHLEDQISHLNGKISEDSEELEESKRHMQTMKNNLQKEIDNWKEKLRASEKKAQETLELLASNEALFKKEKLELETKISMTKLEKIDLDTSLRAKLVSVETQLMSLEVSKEQEKSRLEEHIKQLQKQEMDHNDKLAQSEQLCNDLQARNKHLQNQVQNMESSCGKLKETLNEKEKLLTDQTAELQKLKEDLRVSHETLQNITESSKSKSSELITSNKEKDDFMLRNAELSQQLTTLQQNFQDERRVFMKERESLELELKSKVDSDNTLQQHCQDLNKQLDEMSKTCAHQCSNSEQILRLEETVTTLEQQMADKNKALKKQEQRLNDLKKTLQRELKVQSLPNDDLIDSKVVTLTPPTPRKNSVTKNTNSSDNPVRVKRKNENERSIGQDQFDSSLSSIGVQDFFVGQSLHAGQRSNMDRTLYSLNNSHATLSISDSHGSFPASIGSHPTHSRAFHSSEFDRRHLEKDINFQYLKHVVMKFMLSREHEAIQLIKAVSLLLRFTPDEQKLIKDTLEWKMSWFGGSQPPALAKGLTNKIVPPSS